jgi:hypothetical protein|tara:strand:+ start:171 stop:566 length:396 start_codon:yes stop_codon:yes gene_type:complete
MKNKFIMLIYPVIIMLLMFMLLGCGSYVKPKIASHIVAVTLEGDTILVPIDRIRPNMYRSYYPIYSNYNYYRPYYGGNNYQFRYSDNRGFSSSNSGNSGGSGGTNNKPKPAATVPDIVTRPTPEVLMKGKK